MEKGFGNVTVILATWAIGDVWGLVTKFFMSVLSTILMPFLLTIGLVTPD